MLWMMMDARPLVALLVVAGVGVWGIAAYPLPIDNVFLEIIAPRNPPVFHTFAYAYATCWFTTPFLAASLACYRSSRSSPYRHLSPVHEGPLPRHPRPPD